MEGTDSLFAYQGEMAQRMSQRDWASTPLGPSESWSPELRTTVAIVLRSRHPMILAWGEEFVMIYNDAFIPTLGAKHPDALGSLLPIEFAEVWDAVGPMQRSVLAGGESTWDEDLPLTIERGSGPEETFFTFCYSHVPDSQGPGGVLAVLAVTTDSVVNAQRLALLNELISAAARATDPDQALTAATDVLGAATSELVGGAFYRPGDSADGDLVRVGQFGEAPPEITPQRIGDEGHPALQALTDQRLASAPATDDFPFHVALPVGDGDEAATCVLVLVPNPLRPFDESHERFAGLVADQVGQNLGVARERALEQSRLASLAALASAKTEFLSSVSHEFRTPLTLLLGPLEDLIGGRAGAIDRADADVMYASAHRLLRMVNGLLDVARIEADGLVAEPEPTDLVELTVDLLRPFDSAAERAGLVLVQQLDPTLGVVGIDPALWEKILINLVANALKFTSEGTITVALDAVDDQLRLRVSDTGVGIPESQLGRVFERFHRVNVAGGRTIEGTGIGLSLVAEAAQAMGGAASVSSEVGSGSVFEVTLPRVPMGADTARSPLKAGAQRSAAEALARELSPLPGYLEQPVGTADRSSDDDRPTILVTEDNPAMRSRVARVLAELGEVVTAPDGIAALETMRAREVDLVVTDVMMPRLDGLGLLEEIRADPLLRSTPVVVLSARAGPEAAAGALESGADDYVVKPFTSGELIARCRTTLELAEHRAIEAAGRARSTLLAGVSHDMQTPLAVITSTLEVLSGDDMTADERQRTADRARARASQLTHLVNRFLDWSRLSMNEPLPLRIGSFDLREAAALVASEHDRAEVSESSPEVIVSCDPQRTEQIIHNLVDNAEKVARSSIEIRLEVAEDVVVLRVIDDGTGVDPEVLPHLFEAFGPSAGPKGNGLGLHVSREAARAQGGDLSLESTGADGSVFALTVPRDAR